MPLSTPSRLPTDNAITSRGPPLVSMSVTARIAAVAVLELLLRRVREELQVVGLRLDRDQAVADPDFTAAVVEHQRAGLDVADFTAADRAGVLPHQLVAEEFAAVCGQHVAPHLFDADARARPRKSRSASTLVRDVAAPVADRVRV